MVAEGRTRTVAAATAKTTKTATMEKPEKTEREARGGGGAVGGGATFVRPTAPAVFPVNSVNPGDTTRATDTVATREFTTMVFSMSKGRATPRAAVLRIPLRIRAIETTSATHASTMIATVRVQRGGGATRECGGSRRLRETWATSPTRWWGSGARICDRRHSHPPCPPLDPSRRAPGR